MFELAVVLVSSALLIVVGVLLLFFLKWLAGKSFLFTTVKEGTVKTIMRGDSVERFIMSFAEFHLNDPTKPWYNLDLPDWEVLPHARTRHSEYDDRLRLFKYLGIYWIGWPWANSVYVYAFEWNETYTSRSDGVEKVLPRAEATDFIYAADFTYAIVTDGAETRDRLPTNELTLVTVAIRNPYRALFSGEDWMRRVTAAINRHVRAFVGGKDYEQLITEVDPVGFSTPIIALNTKLPDDATGATPAGLKGRYGVEIRTADLQTVELAGEGKTLNQAAATRAYTATQEAGATRLTGQAEADVIRMKGEQEATALRTRLEVIVANGGAGVALAGFDAIQAASKGPGTQIIWASNPLGAVVDILKSKTEGGKVS